jgi:hypothetical protein
MRKLAIPLFIVALGASSTELRAAPNQSLHFPVPAPAGAASGADDLRVGIKANGVPTIGSGPIDLIFSPQDSADLVARRAGKGACEAAFSKGGANCAWDAQSSCDAFTQSIPPPLIGFHCTGNQTGANGFSLSWAAGTPTTIGIGSFPFNVGNITNLTADNKGVYTDLGVDIAPRSLIQIRPNGVTGTIQFKIFHTQGGTNPRIANVLVDGSNNDPSEAAALHSAIETALENISPALVPAIAVTTHPLNDATYPLTAFGFLKQATSFAEITNINAVLITEVEVVVPAGMAFTVEGTENVVDPALANVPTLSGWGALIATTVLLLMILWMHRRRMRQQQA